MRKALRIALIFFLLWVTYISSGLALEEEEENTVTGKILELGPESNLIQVGNHNYIVTTVLIDNGTSDRPFIGRFENLEPGSLVRIYLEEGQDQYFKKTRQVILFLGVKREEITKKISQ